MSVALCVAVRGCGRGCGTKTATQNATLTLVWNELYYATQKIKQYNLIQEVEFGVLMLSQQSISFLVMHKVSCRFLILRKCSTFLCTRWGWYPRTGKGQRLIFKEVDSEFIWLATCQSKIYKNKPLSARHKTINS